MKRKKILFVISCIRGYNTGKGGHYYSLISTVLALTGKVDAHILLVGNKKSSALEKSGIYHTFLNVTVLNFSKKINGQLAEIQKAFNPDIIHCFDMHFFGIIRYWCSKNDSKILLSQCGGKNLDYLPFSPNLILFSAENHAFYSSQEKFRTSHIALMPARVIRQKEDMNHLDNFRNKHSISDNDIVLLRIARIGPYYKHSILQSIELARALQEQNKNIRLVLVGNIESEETAKAIKALIKGTDILETDDIFTHKASRLIPLSTFVCGTGRGLMEAASYGKILFSPLKNSRLPLLLSKRNWNIPFLKNFSERTSVKPETEKENESMINQLMSDAEWLEELEDFSKELFEENFNMEKQLHCYLEFYNNLRKDSFQQWPDIKQSNKRSRKLLTKSRIKKTVGIK